MTSYAEEVEKYTDAEGYHGLYEPNNVAGDNSDTECLSKGCAVKFLFQCTHDRIAPSSDRIHFRFARLTDTSPVNN